MKEFENIIGYSSIKKELMQIADTLNNSEAYSKLGVTAPKGLLLYGEPGVGKTLMANSLAKASGRKIFTCRKNKPNGDFVNHIKKTFNKAAENAPSIVFLDDMDKFANGDERHRDAEEYVTVQSCIDEVKNKEVFVLATANNIRTLPHSLLRAGRFDRVIKIDAPVGEDAIQIIKHYLSNKKFVSEMNINYIAKVLNGNSCAELETVINEAGLYAGYERSECITMQHFIKACMKTIFKIYDDYADTDINYTQKLHDKNCISTQTIYHETGHAVVSEILSPESVTVVSVTGNRSGNGGLTAYYRNPALNHLTAKKYNIIGSLAGMAALEQKFGIVDCGASKDISMAYDLLERLVDDECIFGFTYYSEGYSDSEDLKARKEHIIHAELERYYRKAKEIITSNFNFFEAVARSLAEKKVLTEMDIQEIKSNFDIEQACVA